MKTFLTAIALALGIALLPIPASAQYPAKAVHLIVPFPAGGPSDTAARTVGQALAKSIGQSIIVDNRPGANGAIAAQAVLTAPPDGYALLWATASMVALPLFQKSRPFESFAEFTPVSMIGRFTFALFVHPNVPAKSVAELITYARGNPGKLSYATGSPGEFMSMAQLMKVGGFDMLRVPYKGGAQAMPDLIAGRVQVYITPIGLGLPYAKDNRLRLLATLLSQRSAAAPEVPTIAEAGMAGVSVPTWQAIVAPPKTPPEIAERLHREIRLVLQDRDVRAQFDRQAFQIEGSTPVALAASIKDEFQAWSQFVRENDITPE